MKDVESRKDIVQLLERFYEKAFLDETIGYFFTTVVPLNLETHIPVIADFWEMVVFRTGHYARNVMELHQQIDHLSPIRKPHLDRWVELFHTTIDQSFEGPNAELMKQRGRSVATIMEIKFSQQGKSPINP